MRSVDEKAKRRHHRVVRILRAPIGVAMRLWLNFRPAKVPDIKGPFLLLANHVTDFDPIFVVVGMKKHMYFVASANILRAGFLSKLLKRYLAPISREKGVLGAGTALDTVRSLRAGNNVAIFPEGNRSFDGLTGDMYPATVKLAKASGASLVTYRLSGGYFTSPRWGYTIFRRGRMSGEVVGVYSPEQLKAMSAEEIEQVVKRDLAVDAYADQAANPVRYRARKLAEGLECVLYTCPECGGIGSMTSSGNELKCSCGAAVKFLDTGSLAGGKFRTIPEWTAWQRAKLAESFDSITLSDVNCSLYKVDANERTFIASGEISLTKDNFSACGISVAPQELSGFGIFRRNTIMFALDGVSYELRGERGFCAYKYLDMYNMFEK